MRKQVLFVCIFNVKRSVVAQHMMHRMLEREGGDHAADIQIASAGFVGPEVSEWFAVNAIPYPEPLFDRTPPAMIQAIMANRGFDLSGHHSQPVNKEILDRSQLIIPLLEILKNDLLVTYPDVKNKIVLPKELIDDNVAFLWEDTTAVPNDSRMFEYAHGNKAYVIDVINEIEDFLQKSFHNILQCLSGKDD